MQEFSKEELNKMLADQKQGMDPGFDEKAIKRSCRRIGTVWIFLSVLSIAFAVFEIMMGNTHPLLFVSLLLSISTFLVAFGFRKCAAWSWLPSVIMAVLMLPAIPIGTLLGGYSIYLLMKGKKAFR